MGSLSADYQQALEDCRAFHEREETAFPGFLVYPHIKAIRDLIIQSKSRSLLDYGCGKGKQYEVPIWNTRVMLQDFWGVSDIRLYDPAWPPLAEEPRGPADLVICTHVLGSIPKADLPVIIDRLYSLATKALYVGETIIPKLKKQIFRNPEPLAIGLQEDDWTKLLKRNTDLKVRVGFNYPNDERMKAVKL